VCFGLNVSKKDILTYLRGTAYPQHHAEGTQHTGKAPDAGIQPLQPLDESGAPQKRPQGSRPPPHEGHHQAAPDVPQLQGQAGSHWKDSHARPLPGEFERRVTRTQ